MDWDRELNVLKMEEAARNFEKAAIALREAEEDLDKIYFLPWVIRKRLKNYKN